MRIIAITFSDAAGAPHRATVRGMYYKTTSTGGAGLVCDVFMGSNDTRPVATFSGVSSVTSEELPGASEDEHVKDAVKGTATSYAKTQASLTEFRDQTAHNAARARRAQEERP